jgi:cytochrome c553
VLNGFEEKSILNVCKVLIQHSFYMMYNYSASKLSKYLSVLFFLLINILTSGCLISQTAGNSQDTIQEQLKEKTKGSDTIQSRDTGIITSVRTPGPADTVKQLPDSVVYKKQDFTGEEIIRGERLFHGLAYLGDKAIDCAHCHNTRVSDTLNWNPDALEISVRYKDKTARELSRTLLKPSGKLMREVHKDFNLSAEDIVLIKAYMNEIIKNGIVQSKPIVTNLLILIFASVLFLISILDLIIKKFFRKPLFNWLIISVTAVVITWILAVNAVAFGRSKGFSPFQPIKFSHAVHAGQNKTDCIYCHYSAKTGKSAGIPSSSVCWNCHFLVRNGTRSGAWEISKIVSAIETNKSVEWVRIYKLPDFVYFNHSQHVTAGKINCATCHGDVTVENKLSQVNDLAMGWCLDCHETRKVNLANEYYKTYYPEKSQLLQEGKIDSVLVRETGGWDCGKCHY